MKLLVLSIVLVERPLKAIELVNTFYLVYLSSNYYFDMKVLNFDFLKEFAKNDFNIDFLFGNSTIALRARLTLKQLSSSSTDLLYGPYQNFQKAGDASALVFFLQRVGGKHTFLASNEICF